MDNKQEIIIKALMGFLKPLKDPRTYVKINNKTYEVEYYVGSLSGQEKILITEVRS